MIQWSCQPSPPSFFHTYSPFLSCITCMSTFATMVFEGIYPIKWFNDHVNLRNHRFCTHIVLFEWYNMYVKLRNHGFWRNISSQTIQWSCQPSQPSFMHTYSPFLIVLFNLWSIFFGTPCRIPHLLTIVKVSKTDEFPNALLLYIK